MTAIPAFLTGEPAEDQIKHMAGVEQERIEAILREPNQLLEQKCRGLIEAARTAGGPDNITAVLLRAV